MITHMQVNVKKLHENAVLPTYGSTNAAGADLYACIDAPLTIAPHETVMVHTGLAMEIPEGYAGLVYARSGLAAKRHLAPANKVGVVDSDYRGEFMVALHNHSNEPQTIEPKERIAQLDLRVPVFDFDTGEFVIGLDGTVKTVTGSEAVGMIAVKAEETERGVGGFGSTGR